MATAEGLVMEHREDPEEGEVVDEGATEEEEEVSDKRDASTIADINWILCLM